MLPNGDWGVRLHVSASRQARIGDTVEVAVTARSGRVTHVKGRVFDIVENEHGDRQAIAEIVEQERGRSREPAFDAAHGVTESCPVCGTTAFDSGITGRCTISPEQHPDGFGDIPLADTPREEFDTHVEPIALAQDWDHWSAQINRGEFVRAFASASPTAAVAPAAARSLPPQCGEVR